MSATAEPLKQFTIPPASELDVIVNGLYKADNPVDRLRLDLLHATGGVPKPLAEFAKPPTIEDVGALYLFACAIENCGDNLAQWAREILGMLEALGSQEADDA
jgi:hypothetical protein